jgi:TfoX/Sxy family transcriptional regulator of competence genes
MVEACVGLPTRVQKMFGGHGYFAPNGGMFAGIVPDDELVIKLQAGPARDELIGLGGRPWVYEGKKRPMTMHEWIVVPDGFYDDVDLLRSWLKRAHVLVPAKKTTTKPTAKKATAKPTAKKATAKPTAKKATAKPTAKKATAKPTAKKATSQRTAKKARAL